MMSLHALRRAAYLFCGLMCLLMAPATAMADDPDPDPGFTFNFDECVPGGPQMRPYDFTFKIVLCMEYSIEQATFVMLNAISQYMVPVVSAMIVLAMAVFGIRVLGGEQKIERKAVGFLLRLALVWVFSFSLGAYAAGYNLNLPFAIFNTEDALIRIVSGHPWHQIDEFLGQLIGFGPEIVLTQGMTGMIGAALFSSTSGVVLFLAGISALLNLLLFIFRIVFTYLMSITVIAFMIIISPLIIPLALFFHTERYFTKWLDILLSAMLTPVLLFAFLTLFLGIFSSLINDILFLLCGQPCIDDPRNIDFSAFWKINEPKFGWLIPSDPNLSSQLQHITGMDEAGTPAVQTYINPWARRAHDANVFVMPGIDFGPSNAVVMQQMVYVFLSLWIFASFMKSMVDKIPEIANNIANAASGINMHPTDLEHTIRKNWNKAQETLRGR